ncbi:hypothetical protein ADK98_09360, partial [Streptomyces sp. H036]
VPGGFPPPEGPSPPPMTDGGLPGDHAQAIVEVTKRVAARVQLDEVFGIRGEEAGGAIEALELGGIERGRAAEDWLVKGRGGGEEIDLIFELARRPVSTELLER